MVSIMKRADTTGKRAPRRRRRRHSAQFKAQVIAACAAPGTSMGAVAQAHGLNVSLVRRWLKARAVTGGQQPVQPRALHGFVPVTVDGAIAQPIRVEVRRGNTTVNVEWPTQAAAQCAAWLQEWLR
jgi:transposase